MEYHASKYQRNKDPFAENPLPKPFYYPSPTKEVDEQEAIWTPGWNRKKLPQENVMPDSLQLSTSALPHVQTLDSHGHDLTSIADGNLDETWPSSMKSSSLSFVKNDSDISSASQLQDVSDVQNGIAELVKNLSTKSKTGKENSDFSNNGTAESVLKRYIERFRYSDPRPREERLKERDKTKQEFWWLKSSPVSNRSKSYDEDKEKWTSDKKKNATVLPESQTKTQLTKEALMVLDEETLKLQLKADRLLSKSESSLTSGPIVSTDGLGSSVSGSSQISCPDSQPPYQPAFLKKQEIRTENRPRVLLPRSGVNRTSDLPADDILVRWRLSRKLGCSGFPPSCSGLVGTSTLKSTKTLDPRLEDFRRKLLSQKALITKEEIDFERRRMALLLDDEESEIKKHSECPKEITAPVSSDPILERMSQITSHVKPLVVTTTPATAYSNLQTSHYQNANFSNAGTRRDPEISEKQLHLDTKENKNNTASSGVINTGGQGSSSGDLNDVSLDHFTSQVVCDPKDNFFSLHHGNIVVSDGGDAVKSVHVKSAQLFDNGVEKILVPKERVKESGDSITSAVKGKTVEKNTPESKLTDHHQSEKHDHKYHQYLEAEKPSAEIKETDVRNPDYEESAHLKFPSSRDQPQETVISEDDLMNRYASRSDQKIHHKNNIRENLNRQSSDVSDNQSDNSETFHHTEVKNTARKKAELQRLENSEKKINRKAGRIRKMENASSPKVVHHSEEDLSLHMKHPVQAAIGQTVREQMFEGRSLFSSVDSWASMFSESLAPAQSLCDSHLTSPSALKPETASVDHLPLQSTPINHPTTSSPGLEEPDGYQSDGEFIDDPLLSMLREQRNHFIKQLELVELKLQEIT